jgi:hypothetical protein
VPNPNWGGLFPPLKQEPQGQNIETPDFMEPSAKPAGPPRRFEDYK